MMQPCELIMLKGVRICVVCGKETDMTIPWDSSFGKPPPNACREVCPECSPKLMGDLTISQFIGLLDHLRRCPNDNLA